MTKVFEKSIIGKIKLNNKIIRSATHEGMADKEGFPTDKLKNLYIKLAKGGVGAIITGYTGVLANGKASLVGMTMIDDNKYIPKFQEVTEAVHEHNTPIILQLAHCGRQTRSVSTGYPIVAPSAIRDKLYNDTIPLELTDSGINEIIDAFVSSIVRAKKSNFDGVQLHLAHGYLLAQFLSSYTNRRKDKWSDERIPKLDNTKVEYEFIREEIVKTEENVIRAVSNI